MKRRQPKFKAPNDTAQSTPFLEAGWAGGALLLGAALGSALSFELVEVAYRRGGFLPMVIGFLAGSALYTGANAALAAKGAKHRKRSSTKQPSESNQAGSGVALATGAARPVEPQRPLPSPRRMWSD